MKTIEMKKLNLIAVAIVVIIAACIPCKSYTRNAHYSGFADLGYSTGHGKYGFKQVFVTTTHGVSILSNSLFIGAGIGFGASLDTSNIDNTYTLPIYAASRYTLNEKYIKPFLDLKIGYAHMWDEVACGGGNTTGGFYLAPSVGITTPAGKIGFNIAIGYSVIRAKYEKDLEPILITDKYNAGGLFMTLGVSF
jgi:hypothetical protein